MAAVALLLWRDSLILGNRSHGELLDGGIALANKLSGLLHPGQPLPYASLHCLPAALLLEWLPALLFTASLYLWAASRPRPVRRMRIPRSLPLLGAASVALIAAGLSLVCFQGLPHVQDSITQQFQAQVFARGRVFGEAPPLPEFFPAEFMVRDGARWYSQYPPGQAILLALGVLVGAPWLVNPLLGALSALLLYGTGRRLYGRRTARLALGLFCLSPFVWFMCAEQMSHTGTLFWVSAGLYVLAPLIRGEWNRGGGARRNHPATEVTAMKARSRPAPTGKAPFIRLAASAFAFGVAVSTRPLCGVAVALPVLGAAVWASARRARQLNCGPRVAPPLQWRAALTKSAFADWGVPVLAAGAGLVVGTAPLLWFNWATTGSPVRSGYEVQWGNSGWGFGTAQWGPPHTLAAGVAQTLGNWDAAAKYLFEWPIPSLLPLLGLAWVRLRLADRVLLAALLSLTLAYLPYFYQDLCLGPRFLFAGVPALALLSARGLAGIGIAWSRRHGVGERHGLRLSARAAALCCAVGLAVNLPVLLRWYGSTFWGVDRSLVDAVRDQGLDRAVVFIRDHNAARAVWLRRKGVSRPVTQAAVACLDPRFIEAQMAALDGAALEARLQAAVCDPHRRYRRTGMPWDDPEGPSSNVYLGLVVNTPDLVRQDVIFALDLGEENRRLLRRFPGRAGWVYAASGSRPEYGLTRMPAPAGTLVGKQPE